MTADELRAFPAPQLTPPDCACAEHRAAGWESITQPLGEPVFSWRGSLRAAGDEEPGFEEWPGSRYWSVDAPIALGWFPYNRCEVWACKACARGFLQYTEYGGYYVDHRLRAIDPARVV
jgi:hypothetical protein